MPQITHGSRGATTLTLAHQHGFTGEVTWSLACEPGGASLNLTGPTPATQALCGGAIENSSSHKEGM
jgi:hypothetical protein